MEEAATANQQLQVLAALVGLLDEAVIGFWLRGGWALDFHLGCVSRPHDDIDLVVAWSCREDLDELLSDLDPNWLDPRGEGVAREATWRGESIGAILAVPSGDGSGVTPGYEEHPWIVGTFSEPPLSLSGITAPALSVPALLEEKVLYERDRGRPLRPKDRQSILLLEELIGVRPPRNRPGDLP